MIVIKAWSVPKSSDSIINRNQKDCNLSNSLIYLVKSNSIFAAQIQSSNHRKVNSFLIYSFRNQIGNYCPTMENITRISNENRWQEIKKNVCEIFEYEVRSAECKRRRFQIQIQNKISETGNLGPLQYAIPSARSYGHDGSKQVHPSIYVRLASIFVDMPTFPCI